METNTVAKKNTTVMALSNPNVLFSNNFSSFLHSLSSLIPLVSFTSFPWHLSPFQASFTYLLSFKHSFYSFLHSTLSIIYFTHCTSFPSYILYSQHSLFLTLSSIHSFLASFTTYCSFITIFSASFRLPAPLFHSSIIYRPTFSQEGNIYAALHPHGSA